MKNKGYAQKYFIIIKVSLSHNNTLYPKGLNKAGLTVSQIFFLGHKRFESN